MNKSNEILAEMILLPPPLPVEFLTLAGYKGRERFIGIWYEATNATIADGRLTRSFSYRQAYEPFVRHPAISCHLTRHNADLGSDDSPAGHMLILDREEARVYLATQKQGRALLKTQTAKMTEADRKEAVEEAGQFMKQLDEAQSLAEFQRFGMFEFFGAAAEDRSAEIRAMRRGLDQYIPPEVQELMSNFYLN